MSNYTPKWIHRIKLENGKWIFVPSQSSRLSGKAIVKKVKLEWAPPKYFYHLRRGGHLAALNAHLENKYFSRLDIKNFFGSITASRITRTLKPYFGYNLSRDIAKQSTVRIPGLLERKLMLPFGFIQSAILASICLDKSSLGIFLKRIKRDKSLSLSVYMDDILISSNDQQRLIEVTAELKSYFSKSHWVSNAGKEVIAADSMTAFNIDMLQYEMRVSEEKMKQFAFNFSETENINKKKGIYSYVKTVNDGQLIDLVKVAQSYPA